MAHVEFLFWCVFLSGCQRDLVKGLFVLFCYVLSAWFVLCTYVQEESEGVCILRGVLQISICIV